MENAKVATRLLERVDKLESRTCIRDLASNYCHGFDKRDFDRFISIWWPDCVWDIGPPFGRFEGHTGIHEAVHQVLWPAWQESHHLATNQVIEFSNPDNADSICDVGCVGTLAADGSCQIVGATYYDELQRRNDVWKIRERSVRIHYFNPIPDTRLSAPGAENQLKPN